MPKRRSPGEGETTEPGSAAGPEETQRVIRSRAQIVRIPIAQRPSSQAGPPTKPRVSSSPFEEPDRPVFIPPAPGGTGLLKTPGSEATSGAFRAPAHNAIREMPVDIISPVVGVDSTDHPFDQPADLGSDDLDDPLNPPDPERTAISISPFAPAMGGAIPHPARSDADTLLAYVADHEAVVVDPSNNATEVTDGRIVVDHLDDDEEDRTLQATPPIKQRSSAAVVDDDDDSDLTLPTTLDADMAKTIETMLSAIPKHSVLMPSTLRSVILADLSLSSKSPSRLEVLQRNLDVVTAAMLLAGLPDEVMAQDAKKLLMAKLHDRTCTIDQIRRIIKAFRVDRAASPSLHPLSAVVPQALGPEDDATRFLAESQLVQSPALRGRRPASSAVKFEVTVPSNRRDTALTDSASGSDSPIDSFTREVILARQSEKIDDTQRRPTEPTVSHPGQVPAAAVVDARRGKPLAEPNPVFRSVAPGQAKTQMPPTSKADTDKPAKQPKWSDHWAWPWNWRRPR